MLKRTRLATSDARAPEGWLIKPSELVDVVELQPLTLTDRRTFTLLVHHAWTSILEDRWHEVSPNHLRVNRNQNDRVMDTLLRLRGCFVNVVAAHRDETGRKIDEVIHNIPLLHDTKVSRRRGGNVYYRFHPTMMAIISNSETYAKLNDTVIRSMDSKYGLVLYEMVQNRATLRSRSHEDFSLPEIRKALGVPDEVLMNFPHLRQRALMPAAREVSAKSDFDVAFHPLTAPRSKAVVAVRLFWTPRRAQSELPVHVLQDPLH